MAKRKLRLSKAERSRRSRQARINFGKRKGTKKRKTLNISKTKRITMPKKKRTKRQIVGQSVLLGLALTSTAEPFFDKLASSIGINISDDIIKAGAGYWLSRKTGIVKGIGYGLFARGSGNIVGNLLSGTGLGGLFGGQKATTTTTDSSIVQ